MYEIQVEIHLPPLLFNFSRICGRCTVQYRTETCNGTTETVLKKRQRVLLWNGHQEIFTLQSFQQRETISKKIFLWPETFLSGGGGARGFSFPTIGKMALLRGEFCFLKSVVFSMFFLSRATVCWLQECNLAWAAKSSPEESYREEPVFKATPFCLFASTF